MGCCAGVKDKSSISRSGGYHGTSIVDIKPPPAVEEIRANDQLVARMRQVSAFKCQVASPMMLHNHLVHARETMKAQDVLIFNIGKTSELEVNVEEVLTLAKITEEL